MRKTTTFNIEGLDLELTVNELTMRQICGLVNEDEANKKDAGAKEQTAVPNLAAESGLGKVDKFLSLACPKLTREVAMDLAPSELRQVWNKFAEVNADFLEIAAKAGLGGELLDQVQAAIRTSIVQSVASSVPATAA